jgi:hypothetical protein
MGHRTDYNLRDTMGGRGGEGNSDIRKRGRDKTLKPDRSRKMVEGTKQRVMVHSKL